MDSLPESGRLSETPLPRVLMQLHQARFGGALTLSRERVGKRFLFQEGTAVYAESNLASESLGVQLLDAGKIKRPDYTRVCAYIEKKGCKEGKALLELGLLEPKELFNALKEQVRIRIVECFAWPEGDFIVDATAAPPAEAQPFRTEMLAVIQAGMEAHWSNDRVLSELGPRMEKYPRRVRRFDKVADRLCRDSAVEALLESLDGTRNFWKSVQAANTPRALAAAWVLVASGALEFGDEPVRPDFDPLEANVEVVVEKADDGAGRVVRASGGTGTTRPVKAATADRAAALLREIDEKHARLDELDHYALLGVAVEANTADIKRAYLQAAKTYHPDALARAGLDVAGREKANRVFASISRAHSVLADPASRNDYDLVRGTSDTDIDANRLAQAETNYLKAEILLRQGNFKGALEYLRPAVELWPEEATYQSALGWALYKQMPPQPEEARKHLEEAARLDPDDGQTQFRLSVVLRDLGDEEAASAAEIRARNAT